MSKSSVPLIISANTLHANLSLPDLVIVDLCKEVTYQQSHIPGAVHLNYQDIIRHEFPAMGLLPDAEEFSQILGSRGIAQESWIVAYDEEGGGKASRLLWTLQAAGHKKVSLLDGGLHAWHGGDWPLTAKPSEVTPTEYPVRFGDQNVANRQYILEHLNDDNVVILDARSPAEYDGSDVRAERGGHVPGAVNVEWSDAFDRANTYCLKNSESLLDMLGEKGVTPDKEVIAYCHTHHRSALSCIVLQHLGFAKVRGYPGSWSDWGNAEDTPIEQ